MNQKLFIFVALALSAAACGATQSTQDGGRETGTSCSPGKQIACACLGGGDGVQVCKADGSGYGACQCGDGGKVDGGKDGARDSTIMDGGKDSCDCGDGGIDGRKDAPTDTSMKDAGACVLEGGADAGPGGKLNWAKRFGTTGTTDSTSVAVAPTSGDVALTGYFFGKVDLGGGDLAGGDAGGGGFLARFNSAGSYKWAKSITNNVEPYGVAVDGSGNVAMGGNFSGVADFGGGPVTSTGSEDIFLAKYNSTGAYVWSKHFGLASNFCFFRRAVFDSTGDLYVVGELSGNAIDLGCGALPAGMSMFVAQFSTSGACVWSKAFGTNTVSEVLALDSSANLLVGGGYYGSINFGGGTLSAGIGMDAFVAKFDSAGTLAWSKTFGSGSAAAVGGIGADLCGNVLIDGVFTASIDFGLGALTTAGDSDIFLAKLDSAGSGVWSFRFGDSANQGGGPLAVDGAGGPAITGLFDGSVNFGGGTLNGTTAPNESMYVAKFTSAGAYEWAYAGGPPASTAVNSGGEGIAANASVVVTTGTFNMGTLNLAGDALPAVSMQDTYLASFVP